MGKGIISTNHAMRLRVHGLINHYPAAAICLEYTNSVCRQSLILKGIHDKSPARPRIPCII